MRKQYWVLIGVALLLLIGVYVIGLLYVKSHRESGWRLGYNSKSRDLSVGRYVTINKALLFGERITFWQELYGFILGGHGTYRDYSDANNEIGTYFSALAMDQFKHAPSVQNYLIYAEDTGLDYSLVCWTLELRYVEEEDCYNYDVQYYLTEGVGCDAQWVLPASDAEREVKIGVEVKKFLESLK